MWLLEQNVRQAIERAIAAGMVPTVEQQTKYEAEYMALSADSNGPRLLTIAGDIAEISISGVLTKAPDFMAMLFGGGNTTYADIIAAVAAAEQSPEVNEVILAIDSPGGSIDGLFDALEILQGIKKPTKAVVANVAASAAYAIASQADTIVASNRAVRVGSVGVVASFFVSDDTVQITSTKAPNKRPDVTTKKGADVIRAELDQLHELFVDAIASGRGVTAKKIDADFGKGATVLAGEALNRGMIDSIAGAPLKAVSRSQTSTASDGGTQSEAITMDLSTLRAEHAATYDAAVDIGILAERDRVTAHLIMGETSGDMKTARAAIEDGSPMTGALQATYMAAGMNRSDTANRQDDDLDAEGANNTNAGDESESDSEQVASLVELKLGIDTE